MRWLQVAFGISLVTSLGLQIWARRERREYHLWRGFRGNGPMDLGGEEFDPANYTPVGRRRLRWCGTAYVITLCLGLALLYASLD
jgi:hypothetical protein